MMTIRIWWYILSLLLAAGLGGFVLALCVAGSVSDRASVSEHRALELSLALRELMAEVQTFVAGAVWFEEATAQTMVEKMAAAMRQAAEVLGEREGRELDEVQNSTCLG